MHLFTSKISPDIVPPANLVIHVINLKHIFKPIRNFFFDKKLKTVLKRKEFDFILSLERTSTQYHVIAPSTHKGYLVAKKSMFYDLIDLLQIYLDKKAFHSAKIVYACSEMIKNEIIEYYGLNENLVKVLYPPTNVVKFNTLLAKDAAKALYNLKQGKKFQLLMLMVK